MDVRQQEMLHDDDDLREEPDHSFAEVPLRSETIEEPTVGAANNLTVGLLARSMLNY